MPWARFECDFWQDARVLELSDGAFRLWVSAIAWSAGHLTDGVIPRHVVGTLLPRKRQDAANKLAQDLLRARRGRCKELHSGSAASSATSPRRRR